LGADERRATNKWARKGDRLMATEKASEKVACGIAEPGPVPPRQGSRRSMALRADLTQAVRRPALSRGPAFWFGRDLAPKRIFHTGSAK